MATAACLLGASIAGIFCEPRSTVTSPHAIRLQSEFGRRERKPARPCGSGEQGPVEDLARRRSPGSVRRILIAVFCCAFLLSGFRKDANGAMIGYDTPRVFRGRPGCWYHSSETLGRKRRSWRGHRGRCDVFLVVAVVVCVVILEPSDWCTAGTAQTNRHTRPSRAVRSASSSALWSGGYADGPSVGKEVGKHPPSGPAASAGHGRRSSQPRASPSTRSLGCGDGLSGRGGSCGFSQ